jgi:peptidoglycan/xylan/chitin deacetylase (PgdA/CDA1 family)
MPSSTVTRHHLSAIAAAFLIIAALLLGHPWWCLPVVVLFLSLVGLGVAFPQLSFFGPYVCHGTPTRRCVALTFDDGPDSRSTPALLDLLGESRVPAAFFCVGRKVDAERELAARIVREGHLLENHSYTHSNATNFFTVARLRDELDRTQSVVREATGVAPSFFRPPMGLSNPRTFAVARAAGLKVIGWTTRGLDTRITSPQRIVKRIAHRLKPGAIILLHDGNIPPDRLVPTVKILLDTLGSLGYQLVRLDKLLE